MSALEAINVRRAVAHVKREITKALQAGVEISSDPEVAAALYKETATRLAQMFPQTCPVSVGEPQIIDSFHISKNGTLTFYDRDEEIVEWSKRCKYRSRRLIKRWAKRSLGMLICDVTFRPLTPATRINLNFTVKHESTSPLLRIEEHPSVQGRVL